MIFQSPVTQVTLPRISPSTDWDMVYEIDFEEIPEWLVENNVSNSTRVTPKKQE